ncbi:MAG: N-formylglutamate deformylase [Pirellulales bacterium]|nr:N-formylglutamate deformylase [Pirellulales bacterium]
MNPVEVQQGDSAIVLGIPHTGTGLPSDIAANLNARGRELTDTDWHIHRLYEGLLSEVTTVRATFHRYVIDANRDPSGRSMYPHQNTTDLVPLTDFDGNSIWEQPPSEAEILRRKTLYHAPFHDALAGEIGRVYRRHGIVILFDCHSIRSRIPFLFEGTLPDFNIGSNESRACDRSIERCVREICEAVEGYRTVVNARFRGGWTTRHYGRPGVNQHAIQMELAQSTYLVSEKAPWKYDDVKASRLRKHLSQILNALVELVPSLKEKLDNGS